MFFSTVMLGRCWNQTNVKWLPRPQTVSGCSYDSWEHQAFKTRQNSWTTEKINSALFTTYTTGPQIRNRLVVWHSEMCDAFALHQSVTDINSHNLSGEWPHQKGSLTSPFLSSNHRQWQSAHLVDTAFPKLVQPLDSGDSTGFEHQHVWFVKLFANLVLLIETIKIRFRNRDFSNQRTKVGRKIREGNLAIIFEEWVKQQLFCKSGYFGLLFGLFYWLYWKTT